MYYIVILSILKDKLLKYSRIFVFWPFQGLVFGLLELIDRISPFLGSWEVREVVKNREEVEYLSLED